MNTDLDPQGPPPERPVDLASIVPPDKLFAPGVYFGLDEAAYHAAFGLSYSGIKSLRISPYDWWVRSALNPRQADVLAELESDAKELGKAYDDRIISGREYFYRRYAATFYCDRKDVLRTKDDLVAYLVKLGLKKSGSKEELTERILLADPSAMIWDVMEDIYCKHHEGKELIAQGLIDKIETAAAMIERHPYLSQAFTGGAPQVSVFWECEKTGSRCKARFDYLKPKVISDLKTLMPADDTPLEQCIGREIGKRKYYIQAAFYKEAASHIPEFIKTGKVVGLAPASLLEALKKHKEKEWLWIFQLKGVAPVAKGRLLRSDSHLLTLGEIECDNAKHTFRACLDQYGPLPWVDPEEIKALDEADVPAWSLL